MIHDRTYRLALTSVSHYWFFHFYFHRRVKFSPAELHKEILNLTTQPDATSLVISGFRGCGKSSLITLSYAIWSILGAQKKKFVVLIGATEAAAQQSLLNIKTQFEENKLLRVDLGPFRTEGTQWKAEALILTNYEAKITARSAGQNIRGALHNHHRPDVIILDDVENLESVKSLDNREKMHEWLTGDVIPAGDTDTKLIVVGNLLHEDSLVMRLKKGIENGTFDGIYRSYPFMDDNGIAAWPEKFRTAKEIEATKKKMGSETAWQREYMLRILPDEEQIIRPEWIHYYDALPSKGFRYAATGVDVAISKKENADFTAMVSARVYGSQEELKICILPHPVNERMSSVETREKAVELSRALGEGAPTKVLVEAVGYQGSLVEMLRGKNIPAEGVKVRENKLDRQRFLSFLFEDKKILFPRHGAEMLIKQLLNLGFQRHDDLADALAVLLEKILEQDQKQDGIFGYMKQEYEEMMKKNPQAPGSLAVWKMLADKANPFQNWGSF